MPEQTGLNVLLIGGGGREHALATAFSSSPRLATLWTTHPNNPGIAALARPIDAPCSRKELYRLVQACDHHAIDFVVIGPEDPLAEGFADKLRTNTRAVFGPDAAGARLEADKAWAKQLMRHAAIPTAEARVFRDAEAAIAYVESRDEPIVVKASGLAKGKGVVLPKTMDEAVAAVRRIMVERQFGDAGNEVVIEECLKGVEASVLAITDGRTINVLDPCRDHKRLGDDDTGPNTGGMGVYCTPGLLDAQTMDRVQRDILVPTIDALKREQIEFRGVLYAGLMLTHAGPKVLEFNVRFGDPECQALVPRFTSDLLTCLHAAATGRLSDAALESSGACSCCVVLASPGYPDKPRTGSVITGIDEAAAMDNVRVYHAGTSRDAQGRVVTAGGRVLNVVGLGTTLEEAREAAYGAAGRIRFEGMGMRTDIGLMHPAPASG